MGEVLILVLIVISALATIALASILDGIHLPPVLFLILTGAFGFGFFVLLCWILEWVNF